MLIVPFIEWLIDSVQKLRRVDPVEVVIDGVIMATGAVLLAVLVANT